jgi:hypothetical protein
MAFDPFGDHASRDYFRNVAGEPDPGRVRRTTAPLLEPGFCLQS